MASAGFVEELETLVDAEATSSMLEVVPKKCGNVQTISNEAVADANAATIIGEALVAGLASTVDAALFGEAEGGPDGLPGVAGYQTVNADPSDGIDAYSEAIGKVEGAGTTAGAIFMNPTVWSDLSRIKVEDGSEQPVLSAVGGLSQAQPRGLFGTPVIVSSQCPEEAAWVVDTQRVCAVLRMPFTTAVNAGIAFELDGVQVRAVGRVEFAAPYPDAVCRVGVISG